MQDPIKKYYNETRTNYGANTLRRKKILKLISNRGNFENKRILDVGCASGYLAKEFKKDGNFVVGVDISEKFTKQLKSELDQFFVLNVESDDWPAEFLENKFDLIICAEILEHLFDSDEFLRRLKQILKPACRIIITTPNFLVWNNRLRMLFGHFGEKEILYDEGHIRLLSYNGLLKKIKKNGFKVVAEDNIWYPNRLESVKNFLSKNLFVYQSIMAIKKDE